MIKRIYHYHATHGRGAGVVNFSGWISIKSWFSDPVEIYSTAIKLVAEAADCKQSEVIINRLARI